MSITLILSEILTLDRESAIHELSLLKQNITAAEFRKASKHLSNSQLDTLRDVSESEVNRRKFPSCGGFTLGDKVQTEYYQSLVGTELTIVEFLDSIVVCLRPSGTYALGLLAEDLHHI